MQTREKEIVFAISLRRLLVISVLAILIFTSFYSYLTALFAFRAPEEELPVKVGPVWFQDQYGANKTTPFSAGETVRIQTEVEVAQDYWTLYPYYWKSWPPSQTFDLLVIFTVTDPYGKPYWIARESPTGVAPGHVNNYYEELTLQSDAPQGTYTVRVMVWSGWLPSGKALAPAVAEGTFSVV